MSTAARLTARAAAVAVVLGLATTGGAVGAAELVTGATIQDGTITGADVADRTIRGGNVHDGSLRSADVADRGLAVPDLSPAARSRLRGPAGIRGFVVVREGRLVPPGVDASLSTTCPDDKVALSVQGALRNDVTFTGTSGVQTVMAIHTGTVFVRNTTGSTQTLGIQVLCGAVDLGTL